LRRWVSFGRFQGREMTRGSGAKGREHSFRVVLSDADFAVLEHASAVFGVGKSELVRRLVRAAV
jgi:hypothetical protein